MGKCIIQKENREDRKNGENRMEKILHKNTDYKEIKSQSKWRE